MAQPKSFYLKLYLFWLSWVTLRSFVLALFLALFSALIVYIYKGFAPFNEATLLALKEILYLSFPIGFSLSFILMLLLVFRALFFKNIANFRFVLYDCKHEEVDSPLLSDVMMLWRKWLFITVWTILLFAVLFIGLSKLLFGDFPPLSWFNAYTLYLLVSTLGGGVFVFAVKKCNKIGVKHV